MTSEGEHMIPGEEAQHLYTRGCPCSYCLPITKADQRMKFDMEYASEYYDKRKREEESK